MVSDGDCVVATDMSGGPWTLHQVRRSALTQFPGRRLDQHLAGLQVARLGPLAGPVRASVRRGPSPAGMTSATQPGAGRETRRWPPATVADH
jgi:hypothetical protein